MQHQQAIPDLLLTPAGGSDQRVGATQLQLLQIRLQQPLLKPLLRHGLRLAERYRRRQQRQQHG